MIDAEYGEIQMNPAGDVVAGTIGTWTFTFTAGSGGISRGGAVRLLIPNGFSPPIPLEKPWPPADGDLNPNDIEEFTPCDLGFVTVHCSIDSCRFGLSVMDPDESFRHAVRGQNGRFLFCTVEEGNLPPGAALVLTYGDTSTGSAGASTPGISHTADFSAAVDIDGKKKGPEGGFWPLTGSPRVRVLGTAVARWQCIVSSQPREDGTVRGTLVPRDRYDNVSGTAAFELTLRFPDGNSRKQDVELTGWNISERLPDISVPKESLPGRVEVIDERSGLKSRSNPVCSTPAGAHVYWGDLHGHISPDFSRELAEEYYQYGRDVSCLDFTAFTPHEDFPVKLSEKDWEMTQEVAALCNDPGEFVSFYGYEYRNRGDYIVLFEEEGEPFFKGMVPPTHTPERLFEFLEGNVKSRSMLIPHLHYLKAFQEGEGEIGVLSLDDLKSDLIRNVEMYSMHGSAEYPGCPRSQSGAVRIGYSPRVRDVLGAVLPRGLKLGFTGATDTHTGNPGSSQWLRNRVQHPGGITAVRAESLTRKSIWDAIWNHRTYATTGARMIVDLDMAGRNAGSGAGAQMGESLVVPSGDTPRVLSLSVTGTDGIESISIVRGGVEVHTENFEDERVSLQWEDGDILEENTYYYVRIRQRDGHLGWTSPVWVDLS